MKLDKPTAKFNERQDRIRELRQWNTTEDAENAAFDLLLALPDNLLSIGIFATFDDIDDEQSGNGGIHFQYVGTDTVAVVGISATGTFEDCYAVQGRDYIERAPKSTQEAADFLIDKACLCWVGHGACGGCSGHPGIKHEPTCGWEQHPDCPVHPPEPPEQIGAWTR